MADSGRSRIEADTTIDVLAAGVAALAAFE
jgi:hypothetical protein